MKRRNFIQWSIVGYTAGWGIMKRKAMAADNEQTIFIGTYSGGKSEGIYRCTFNSETGVLSETQLAAKIANPSYLAIDANKHRLYAVNEVGNLNGLNGEKSGGVSAFTLDPQTAELKPLNQQLTHGQSPCYVSVDATSRCVLAANYSSGNLAVFPVQEDGSLGEANQVIQHEGSSVNRRRQGEPHAHCIVPAPDNRIAYAMDLGIDKAMIYQLDAANAKLTPADPPWMKTVPGSGPRHITLHPSKPLAYIIHELNSTIAACKRDTASGALESFQTISTLPDDFTGNNTCADIHITPNGKWLYGSNRGHDSIAIYRLDADGKMAFLGTESTRGKTPRNFAIDPSGRYLLAANQDSDSISVFAIDNETGGLSFKQQIEAPKPVCIKFMQENASTGVSQPDGK